MAGSSTDCTKAGLFTPLLQGYQLVDGRYQPIAVSVDAERGECRGFSPLLGLELRGRVEWFRFLNPATRQFLPNRQELLQERQELAQERDAERAARIATEARVRQLEAQLENRQEG